MEANGSKREAMSYERMQQDDARLRAEIQDWLACAQAVDDEEDKVEGDGGTPDPQEEIRWREERLEKMARVRAALRNEVAAARASRPSIRIVYSVRNAPTRARATGRVGTDAPSRGDAPVVRRNDMARG